MFHALYSRCLLFSCMLPTVLLWCRRTIWSKDVWIHRGKNVNLGCRLNSIKAVSILNKFIKHVEISLLLSFFIFIVLKRRGVQFQNTDSLDCIRIDKFAYKFSGSFHIKITWSVVPFWNYSETIWGSNFDVRMNCIGITGLHCTFHGKNRIDIHILWAELYIINKNCIHIISNYITLLVISHFKRRVYIFDDPIWFWYVVYWV